MCDYSLEARQSRPAVMGELLKSSGFPGTLSRGFCSVDDPAVAVCLRPGTELGFSEAIAWQGLWHSLVNAFKRNGSRTAIFRKVNLDLPTTYHDALELADGTMVLLTHLRPGQTARVLQLPVDTTNPPRRGQQHEHHEKAKAQEQLTIPAIL